eukprot:scaffold421_cov382-Prasinococcus_capsulatus_cf.AAC.4
MAVWVSSLCVFLAAFATAGLRRLFRRNHDLGRVIARPGAVSLVCNCRLGYDLVDLGQNFLERQIHVG